jgi:hypothetical protein
MHPELTMALRKLLEAEDCILRAALTPTPAAETAAVVSTKGRQASPDCGCPQTHACNNIACPRATHVTSCEAR